MTIPNYFQCYKCGEKRVDFKVEEIGKETFKARCTKCQEVTEFYNKVLRKAK